MGTPETSSKATRKRRFRPSQALMRDALAAAIEAGMENPTLDILENGTLSVRSGDPIEVKKNDAKASWEQVLGIGADSAA